VHNAFRDSGGNFVDTANIYTNGTSESFLGKFVKGHLESVVPATKYSSAVAGKDPNAAGNHRKHMMESAEASLKRLQTDYIDLYWVHNQVGRTVAQVALAWLRTRPSRRSWRANLAGTVSYQLVAQL
jgi:aryl-alcohol dehydrogenase-like predicted oxidoreductase